MVLITLRVYNSFSFGPPWKQTINTYLIRHLGWLNHIIWFAPITSSISKYKTYLSNCAVLILSENLIFLSASFKGVKADSKKIEEETIRLKAEKEKNQPTRIKTSGSTFKNPILQTQKKVWELIKESVPLDISFGDACISEKHCNFFVNKGDASYDDMIKLIEFVSKKVLEKTGISLETEIKILK